MGPAVIPDGKVLLRFKVGGPTQRDLARQAINEMLVEPTVAAAIKDCLRAEATAPPELPPIIEHPIDDALQVGGQSRAWRGDGDQAKLNPA